jgi:hypothetical protein
MAAPTVADRLAGMAAAQQLLLLTTDQGIVQLQVIAGPEGHPP